MRAPNGVRVRARVGPERSAGPFVVYVEGPRDRDVLEAWVRRLAPAVARRLGDACVILGGRQPARAAGHLVRLREEWGGAQGLCVLDADAPASPAPEPHEGLEVFTWRRRHIESYLLAPAAIERAARSHDTRLRRLLGDELPAPGDERALLSFDAKRFLGPKGALARVLGRVLPAGAIARSMREEEIHPEVRALCARIATGLGLRVPSVLQVTVRATSEEV